MCAEKGAYNLRQGAEGERADLAGASDPSRHRHGVRGGRNVTRGDSDRVESDVSARIEC